MRDTESGKVRAPLTVCEPLVVATAASVAGLIPEKCFDFQRQNRRKLAGVFDGGARRREPAVDLKALHAKIGELTLENDFLEGTLGKAGVLSAKR